jgi:octopine/nopaline transport system substrate-binding protein
VDVKIQSKFDASLGEGIGAGIRQDDVELKSKIDKALCELVADGSIGKASMKWFKTDISRPCE